MVCPRTIDLVASGTGGSLVLKGMLAWCDSREQDVRRAGEHSIVVGEGVACDVCNDDPLEFRSEYGGITT
ncbi:MAG: hypothetical protein OXI46_10350 [Gemmatimonadota bacterium]|nr:hypothetical protein [Gemmatimonadota bacterium]